MDHSSEKNTEHSNRPIITNGIIYVTYMLVFISYGFAIGRNAGGLGILGPGLYALGAIGIHAAALFFVAIYFVATGEVKRAMSYFFTSIVIALVGTGGCFVGFMAVAEFIS